jgi:hypothetical protein
MERSEIRGSEPPIGPSRISLRAIPNTNTLVEAARIRGREGAAMRAAYGDRLGRSRLKAGAQKFSAGVLTIIL